jgi:hypothetical protein
MATTFKPKRKFTSGAPTLSDLERGELAVNTAEQKIYMRNEAGGATPANDEIVTVGGFDTNAATIDDAIVMAIALG